MAAVLQQVLERAELSKLPKSVQAKLERFLADQQSEIDGLRARHERFKVDSEQQYFEVEKRLAQSQERLVNGTQECQTLREELKKLHEQLKLLNEKNKELEAAQDRNAAIQVLEDFDDKLKDLGSPVSLHLKPDLLQDGIYGAVNLILPENEANK